MKQLFCFLILLFCMSFSYEALAQEERATPKRGSRIVLLPERAEELEADEFEAEELDEAAVLPLPFFRGGSKYFTPSRNSSLPRNCFLFSSRNS